MVLTTFPIADNLLASLLLRAMLCDKPIIIILMYV